MLYCYIILTKGVYKKLETINKIKSAFECALPEQYNELIEQYSTDERKGVQNIIQCYQKKIQAYQKEQARLEKMLLFERECYNRGYDIVAGIDEVGRGPLAGPVVTAAVILPKDCKIEGVNDSKKLSPKKRQELYDIICEKAISYGIGVVSSERIDEINILQATYEAMRQSIRKLSVTPQMVLVDAVHIPDITMPQRGIVGGDGKSISIAAASIVAKVTRDAMMEEYAKLYPQYAFEKNKGYGSSEHIQAIKQHGICAIHRKTFIKNILSPKQDITKSDNRAKGTKGEVLAVREMEKMGYTILERNFRRASGEIDIIAQKQNMIVFTEVKLRQTDKNGQPCEAVTPEKQKHIVQTAQYYIAENDVANFDIRFDVAEVLEQDAKFYFKYTENAFWL